MGKGNPYTPLVGMKINVVTKKVSKKVSQTRKLLRVSVGTVSITLGPMVSAWSAASRGIRSGDYPIATAGLKWGDTVYSLLPFVRRSFCLGTWKRAPSVVWTREAFPWPPSNSEFFPAFILRKYFSPFVLLQWNPWSWVVNIMTSCGRFGGHEVHKQGSSDFRYWMRAIFFRVGGGYYIFSWQRVEGLGWPTVSWLIFYKVL